MRTRRNNDEDAPGLLLLGVDDGPASGKGNRGTKRRGEAGMGGGDERDGDSESGGGALDEDTEGLGASGGAGEGADDTEDGGDYEEIERSAFRDISTAIKSGNEKSG